MDERSKYLRRLAVRALEGGNRGHIGPTMSLIEIFRVLYDDIMVYDASDPYWPLRDRVVLSKGHGCVAQYACLAAHEFFPTEWLDKFTRFDSILGGLGDHRVPGMDYCCGSMGQGLAVGVGVALACRDYGWRRHDGTEPRVYVIMGDGEFDEGSVWEAVTHGAKHRLNNLVVLVDDNEMQSAGSAAEITGAPPISKRLHAFGWNAWEVDGHSVSELNHMLTRGIFGDMPTALVCKTIKGKGLPFAERDLAWHSRTSFSAADIAAMREALA